MDRTVNHPSIFHPCFSSQLSLGTAAWFFEWAGNFPRRTMCTEVGIDVEWRFWWQGKLFQTNFEVQLFAVFYLFPASLHALCGFLLLTFGVERNENLVFGFGKTRFWSSMGATRQNFMVVVANIGASVSCSFFLLRTESWEDTTPWYCVCLNPPGCRSTILICAKSERIKTLDRKSVKA